MDEKNNIPQIRFKNFDENWEVKEFKEIFSNLPNNTLSRAELNYQTGLFKNVHYGDVLIKFGELLDVKNDRIPFISNDAMGNKFKLSKLQNGDIIIADTAEDETVGKCTELINAENENVVSGLHTIPVRPIQHFASKYLGYYLNSSSYHDQLLQLMQGIKVLSISKSTLKSTVLVYPQEKLEQSKIGTYFQNLDKLITLQQQKHDKLVTLKKAMLDKMFPKEGADVPEIRFKGYTEDWEEKKLGAEVKITMGQSPNGMYYTDNPENYILVQGNADMKNGRVSPRVWTTEITKTAESGDLIISVRAPVGDIGKTDYDVVIGRGVAGIRGNEFIFQSLIRLNELGYWKQFSSGSTFESINSNVLKEAVLSIPSKDEQTKVGHFFKSFDQLINLQKRELEKLKQIKKACLEKMFV